MGKEEEWQLVGVRAVRGMPSERKCDGCVEVLEAGTEVIVYRRGEEIKAAHSEACRQKVCEQIALPFERLPEGILTRKGEEEYRNLTSD